MDQKKMWIPHCGIYQALFTFFVSNICPHASFIKIFI